MKIPFGEPNKDIVLYCTSIGPSVGQATKTQSPQSTCPSPLADRTRLLEVERDKLALKVEQLKLKTLYYGQAEDLKDTDREWEIATKPCQKKAINWPHESTARKSTA